ncbi:hypothetical protein OHA21_42045 [Actinoplanes sp. NBC_00393]|uniref:hypothetical protein n=1 Tax=Actinoplanes sp. NBC_00393 TaxID=2975953 RepID=UPI002E240199
MTDQIEELFADLRAETLPTVRPPGTEPLRKAVRRRRAVLSGATAIAVLAVAGLVAVIRPAESPMPAVTPASEAPTYSSEQLKLRVAQALDISEPDAPGLGEIITDTGSGPKQFSGAVLGGTYDVRMVCYGTGSMEVSVISGNVGSEPAAVVTPVPCENTRETVLTVPVVLARASSTLMVQVVPDVAGPGRAAFGWQAELAQSDKSYWQQQAGKAFGDDTSASIGSGSEFLSDGGTGYEQPDIEPGRYRVRAVCIGFGTVELSVGPAAGGGFPEYADEVAVSCSPDAPSAGSVTYTASSKGLYYDVTPDAGARHRSAVATVLERY